MRIFNEFRPDNLRGDLFGGVTAAIIALPMALAFGVTSAAGPAAGLYGAMLVGLFGGTPTLISEPIGPMTVVMTAVIAGLIIIGAKGEVKKRLATENGETSGLGACAVELPLAEVFRVQVRFGGRSRSIVGTTRREGAPKRAEVGMPQGHRALPRRLVAEGRITETRREALQKATALLEDDAPPLGNGRSGEGDPGLA